MFIDAVGNYFSNKNCRDMAFWNNKCIDLAQLELKNVIIIVEVS